MRQVVKLGRYECSIGTVGYVYADSVEEAEELCQAAVFLEAEGSSIIHTESVIEALEEMEESGTLEEDDAKLLYICRSAKEQGIDDIIINPK